MLRSLWRAAPLLAAALMLTPASAYAAPTLLTLVNPAPADQQYQQTLNSPCVLGESSCKDPAGWEHSDFPTGGQINDYDVTNVVGADNWSAANDPTLYEKSQISTLLNSAAFIVGIDVNTTTQPLATEYLKAFEVYVGGVLSFAYYAPGCGEGDTDCVGTQLATANNGNGYADALLTGIDLTGFAGDPLVSFRAVVGGVTDGRESFFLISANPGDRPPIPEPGTLALLGTGLFGLARAARRRRAAAKAIA